MQRSGTKKVIKQLNLAETRLLPKACKQTRKAVFLVEMETIVPWSCPEALIDPFYLERGNGRRPMRPGMMLRTHFEQQWFGYFDLAMEGTPHDILLLHLFDALNAIALGDLGYHKANRTLKLFEKECNFFVITPTEKPTGGKLTEEQKAFKQMLSAVRATAEYSFRLVKHLFGFTKIFYRGLAKNTRQVVTLFALANLWHARRRLLFLKGELRT